ncbi:MAG: DinB family protein [Burkholderiales bacterium]
MTPQAVRTLTRYNAWANKAIFDAVAALPAGEATKERPTLFKNMVNTLNHLYVVDLIWQAHLQGREHNIPALRTVLHPELGNLWRAQAEIDGWYVSYGDSLSQAALEEKLDFTLIGGNKGSMRRGEILFHVVNHTSYHRGWVADMFYQIPLQPPTTDLPVFLREQGTPA